MLGTFLLTHQLIDFVESAREFLQQADSGFDALCTQTEFFDQTNRTTTTTSQCTPSFRATAGRCTLAHRDFPVVTVAVEQRLQGFQVVWQTTNDLFFFQTIGHADLNGSVERQLAAVNLLQRLVGFDQYVVVLEQLRAEAAASFFDTFGQLDFLTTCQQRDLAHLRQVHSNRVVRPSFRLIERNQFVRAVQLDFAFGRIGNADRVVVFAVVDW